MLPLLLLLLLLYPIASSLAERGVSLFLHFSRHLRDAPQLRGDEAACLLGLLIVASTVFAWKRDRRFSCFVPFSIIGNKYYNREKSSAYSLIFFKTMYFYWIGIVARSSASTTLRLFLKNYTENFYFRNFRRNKIRVNSSKK